MTNVAISAAGLLPHANAVIALAGVDEFEPVSGCGNMNHAHEAGGKLIISRGNGAVDSQMAEHAFDAVALFVERPIMFNLHPAV